MELTNGQRDQAVKRAQSLGLSFDMLFGESECMDCHDTLRPLDVCGFRPVPGPKSIASQTVCIPCCRRLLGIGG